MKHGDIIKLYNLKDKKIYRIVRFVDADCVNSASLFPGYRNKANFLVITKNIENPNFVVYFKSHWGCVHVRTLLIEKYVEKK